MATLTSNSLDNCNSIPGFMPSGTRMTLHSRLAPPSWTKESSLNNNRALRVTTGTAAPFGTGTAFSTVFPATDKSIQGTINSVSITDSFQSFVIPVASGLGAFNPFPLMSVQPATITNALNASHNHQYDIRTQGSLSVSPNVGDVNGIRSQLEPVATANSPAPAPGAFNHTHSIASPTNTNAASHSHTLSATSHGHPINSSGPHNHSFTTTAQDFNIKYVDIIICIKD